MSDPSVRRWLVEHTPLEPSLLDGAGFDLLVSARLAACGTRSEADYLSMLELRPEELNALIAGIAVPETWFFRYPRSFELLVDFARRRLAEGRPSLRLCSVGCATGQEPYCMAMAALHSGWPPDRVTIEAIDRNSEFLAVATSGRYGPASIRSELPAWALSHLVRHGEAITVDAKVTRLVRFSQADATTPEVLTSHDPFDAVFCRNLLIYLNPAARARLIDTICAVLAPGGLLFVGHAEQSVRGVHHLQPVPAPHAFALERTTERLPVIAVAPPTKSVVRADHTPAPISTPRAARPQPAPPIQETLDDASLLADEGCLSEAERMVRAVITAKGPTGRALELLGLIHLAAGEMLEARRVFQQAVYLEPNRPVALLQLALINERTGDPQRTSMLWNRARAALTRAQPDLQS